MHSFESDRGKPDRKVQNQGNAIGPAKPVAESSIF
jgi:hypothetical protein